MFFPTCWLHLAKDLLVRTLEHCSSVKWLLSMFRTILHVSQCLVNKPCAGTVSLFLEVFVMLHRFFMSMQACPDAMAHWL